MASARAAPAAADLVVVAVVAGRRRRPAFFNAAPAGPRTAVCPPRRRVLPARAPPRGPRRLVAPPCALALATPRGCSARAAPHPSLLAGDRQVLARGGCCIRQGLSPVLMPLPGLAPVSPYFGLRPVGRLSLPK